MRFSFFIAGVPCTGKTWLGNWLQENEDYLHVDAEKDGGADLDKLGIHAAWDNAIQTGRADTLASQIKGLSNPVVLNWGFPPSFLYFVSALQVVGIETWWIHGDYGLARKAFETRGGIDPRCFENQVREIDRHWLLIEHLFGHRIVQGLTETGDQRHPMDLWDEIRNAMRL